jgi:hypothetical protein
LVAVVVAENVAAVRDQLRTVDSPALKGTNHPNEPRNAEYALAIRHFSSDSGDSFLSVLLLPTYRELRTLPPSANFAAHSNRATP